MGASEDFANEGLRRLLVNATYWTLGMEREIAQVSAVDLVGAYKPTPYGFRGYVKNVKPSTLTMPDAP